MLNVLFLCTTVFIWFVLVTGQAEAAAQEGTGEAQEDNYNRFCLSIMISKPLNTFLFGAILSVGTRSMNPVQV